MVIDKDLLSEIESQALRVTLLTFGQQVEGIRNRVDVYSGIKKVKS